MDDEIRMTKEAQNPIDESSRAGAPSDFVIRHSFVIRQLTEHVPRFDNG